MLYVVATPIGNLGDITLRALEVLKGIDVVAAEDTRHSGLLLKHFGIKKPFVSYHEHNEAARTAQLIECLARGENIALITDAGTPGLSDPGMRLIRECISRKLPFTILPGTSSILTALLGSGFATDNDHLVFGNSNILQVSEIIRNLSQEGNISDGFPPSSGDTAERRDTE